MNSYGGALEDLFDRVTKQGWTGPIIITEMGPLGQWQATKTQWNAPIEPLSEEKAVLLDRYMSANKNRVQGQCPFLWGQKQEVQELVIIGYSKKNITT